jgi:hypothetical protein
MGQVGVDGTIRYEDSYGDGCGMSHLSVGIHNIVGCYDFEGDSWVFETSGTDATSYAIFGDAVNDVATFHNGTVDFSDSAFDDLQMQTGSVTASAPILSPAFVSSCGSGLDSCAPFTSSGGLNETSLTGGPTAGRFTTATATTGSTTITMGTYATGRNPTTQIAAPNGWHCSASDQTHPANLIVGTSVSTTQCLLTVVTAIAPGDVIEFSAIAY